mgnify:CR=1 FL=1
MSNDQQIESTQAALRGLRVAVTGGIQIAGFAANDVSRAPFPCSDHRKSCTSTTRPPKPS